MYTASVPTGKSGMPEGVLEKIFLFLGFSTSYDQNPVFGVSLAVTSRTLRAISKY
tara:strand:+ start:189 stop:353 length:165 start_codon:yes stop_codon:yes gene_type:complete